MKDLTSLKYAELRKLAKKAGIKANLKQEKLITELTKFYEKSPGADDNSQKAKDVENETVSKEKVKRTSKTFKTATPTVTPKATVAIQKQSTPSSKVLTPVKSVNAPKTPTTATKVQTPIQNRSLTPSQQAGVTSGSAKPVARWEKKVFTPTRNTNRPVQSPVMLSSTKRKSNTPVATPPVKKKRSTFEKAPTPDLSAPQVDDKQNSKRRSTFEKTPTPDLKTPEVESSSGHKSGRQSSSSQDVQDMLGAMKSNMSDQEMKQSLMSVLDKKAQEKAKTTPSKNTTNIPRFMAFVKKREEKKPITPGNKNWEKIHKKNFEKFDSLDVYLEKKRKRADEITASVKKAKTLLSEVHSAVNKLKTHKTPDTIENKFVKPRTSNVNKTTPFKPTVLNTSKMNLNFGTKPSPKTMPRKSPKSVISSAVKKATSASRKSTGSVQVKKAEATPFKFTAPQSTGLNITIASTKKNAFDLKASLARPLTWRPHKGKLRPFEDAVKSPTYVKPHTTTIEAKTKKQRAQTRVTVAQRRADKKHNAQMARRGIKV